MASANQPAYIVIHNSDSEWGSAEVIDDWHRERGFIRDQDKLGASDLRHIGYQWVIGNGHPTGSIAYERKHDGMVQAGRGETERGAHAKGYNHKSIGVALIGKKKFTPAQITALYGLVLSIMRRWQIPVSRVIGHYEVPGSGKTCPNIDLDLVRLNLARLETSLPSECVEGFE